MCRGVQKIHILIILGLSSRIQIKNKFIASLSKKTSTSSNQKKSTRHLQHTQMKIVNLKIINNKVPFFKMSRGPLQEGKEGGKH